MGISFVMIMLALGVNKLSDLNKIKDYKERLDVARWVVAAKEITDGDTFVLTNGQPPRLNGFGGRMTI